MPLFISDEEFERCSHDSSVVAEKADSFIKDLQRQLETVKAQEDAASITSEQTWSLIEQKYISLSSDFAKLESENAQLNTCIEQLTSELAEVRSEKHQLHLQVIGKDGEIERLSAEVSELHKSKRQLLDLVERKDSEINEKNVTIKSYLDKIVNLTDDAALKQAQLHDREAELARSQATCARLSQEKELIERHNVWLNEELTAKVGDLIRVRKTHNELEADMSSKLADVEKQFTECSSSLRWNKERVKELDSKLVSLQEEFCSSKDSAAANEECFSAEISTVTKLVELYKESSEEWSRKAGELEGVIKALEMHLSQVESDYKEKLEKEVSARKLHEKEAAELKEKLDKCEAEIENYRKGNELSLLPISSFTEETWTYNTAAHDMSDRVLVPKIPVGVSGTALAASLLRDGWSLAKMYEKYQEAVDALRHESMGRKQSQAILERVLYEIEEKAEVILDERAEHERMVEAYSAINQKLQQSTSEQAKLEGTIQDLKADLRRREREYVVAEKEIIDLQKQVTFLLKECRDIQLRCGSASDVYPDEGVTTISVEMKDVSDTERVISERLLTFKDINELVEQNVKLRSLLRSLSDQNEKRDTELREIFEIELKKQAEEAASKVAAVLDRAEEQGKMIESLHSSVAMYKRLYEEELKLRASFPDSSEEVPDLGRKTHMLLLEDSQGASKKAQEQVLERAKGLEEQLDRSRNETVSLRLERDKMSMELNFARERLQSFMKEFEHQRDEMNGVLARNVEFSQLVVDYQRKVRENSDSLHAAEDLSRKLTVEASLLKHEKELLVNSEKRACDEVRSLSERVHRLQATLDTIHSAEEVREEARAIEKRKQEEYMKQVERDWAQAKKELQEERDNVRTLTLDRDLTIKKAMRQVEELGNQLSDALRAVASAESRAAVAEARCSDLEAKFKAPQDKVVDVGCDPSTSLATEVSMDMPKVKEEMEKLKLEALANKDHMLQYKNIAQVNEAALKQIESAHERFKAEADKMKKSLEAEISSLRERLSELESDNVLKIKETASVVAGKEEALSSALAEVNSLKEECSVKISQIMGMEVQISSLKKDLEEEHQRWRTAQNNYERQVILQSETIQELTKTSQALGLLQDEVSKLRKLSDTLKSENGILKDKLTSEKSVLGKLKDEAERKYNEVNEQNKILHTRLEALHIKLAEKEKHSAGTSGSSTDSQGDADLQTVVSYLRRSKEIAETEISLLKQEKLRLQSQLESALKASETAHGQLHAERANSRALLFSDEDFKALQIQVREMNLLRESNLQLREENKHNFEECQKLRELARAERVEMECLRKMMSEKTIEVDSCRKEIEMQNIERGNLENRIAELLGTIKNIDLEEYHRLKDDYQQMQGKFRVIEAELDETRKLVSEKQISVTGLEQELAKSQVELNKREARIKEIEAAHKSDMEKQRKGAFQIKKKHDALAKEKEVLNKEKQALSKQLEDSRQGKRPLGDAISDQTIKEKEKEKDTRIQMLERTLERERDNSRKEREEYQKQKEEYQKQKEEYQKQKEEYQKQKEERLKVQRAVEKLYKKMEQEKEKLLSELEKHKQARESLSEVDQSPETALDNQTAAYLLTVQNLEEAMDPILTDEIGARVPPLETSTMDASSTAARQVPAQALPITGSGVGPSQDKTTDEREKRSNLPKPQNESRKIARRLIRPHLRPQEPSGDTEMSEAQGLLTAEGKKDLMFPIPQSSARKRSASLPEPEIREESQSQPDTNPIAVQPVSKKSRSEAPQDDVVSEESDPPKTLESSSNLDEAFDAAGDQPLTANEMAVPAEKDEVCATTELDEESNEGIIDVVSNNEAQSNELLDASEELFDNVRDTEEGFGDELDGEEQDPLQSTVEIESDREEGEVGPDALDEHDGGDLSCMMSSLETGEFQHVPDVPLSAVDEEHVSTADEVNETMTSTVVDEKNDTVEGAEDTPENSEKSTNDNDKENVETQKSPKASFSGVGSSPSPSNPSDPTVSDRGSHIAPPVMEEEESPAERPTTINLNERARERAQLRVQGVVRASPPANTRSSRAAGARLNARGARGGRGSRSSRGGTGGGGNRGQKSEEGQG
ncbi:hypothetical protein AQUCO_03000279v1 [Aquilegia coerulea]|uniref:Uncharacterized protein n=1 Tax=Aquilegia coerulea TaxID=218851 RepID=A0A2G5D263_AQUCA|nr:hypothetical protein AQUCO_03000279v1 [Aquilegia coerulea]